MADILDLGDDKHPLLPLWQQVVFEPDILRKLEAVDSLISALDSNIAQKTNAKALKAYIHKEILSNENLSRKLELLRRVTEHPETAIEYFGQDYITHPEFHFDSEFWNLLKDVRRRVNIFVGKVLKEMTTGEEIMF